MRCPFAQWRGPIPNETLGGIEPPVVGAVFHIMGASTSAADGWFHNPSAQASAHFGISQDGGLVQWVDTADRAWHAMAANRHWIGVETEGSAGPLSDAGCRTFARLYRWLHDVHGIPFQATDDPYGGHGLGWHGMGGDAWGGHQYCPGVDRRNQRGYILQLAQGGAAPTPKEEDDNMVRLFTYRGGVHVGVFNAWRKWVPTPGVLAYLTRAGFKWNSTDGTTEVQPDVYNTMIDLGTLATK